jgi:hypothetical protein
MKRPRGMHEGVGFETVTLQRAVQARLQND